MHFIPNPSNTEFIYLVGLEHVVDFLTKETKMPLPPAPYNCSQCNSDFTPVWKWEKVKGKGKIQYNVLSAKRFHSYLLFTTVILLNQKKNFISTLIKSVFKTRIETGEVEKKFRKHDFLYRFNY